jgi:hypothetical protein
MSTGWTSRLKRKGGLRAIQARRIVECKLIAGHKPKSKEEAEMLKGVLEWLLENPVRTLPVVTKEYFGWV